jgi:hypothetical protein
MPVQISNLQSVLRRRDLHSSTLALALTLSSNTCTGTKPSPSTLTDPFVKGNRELKTGTFMQCDTVVENVIVPETSTTTEPKSPSVDLFSPPTQENLETGTIATWDMPAQYDSDSNIQTVILCDQSPLDSDSLKSPALARKILTLYPTHPLMIPLLRAWIAPLVPNLGFSPLTALIRDRNLHLVPCSTHLPMKIANPNPALHRTCRLNMIVIVMLKPLSCVTITPRMTPTHFQTPAPARESLTPYPARHLEGHYNALREANIEHESVNGAIVSVATIEHSVISREDDPFFGSSGDSGSLVYTKDSHVVVGLSFCRSPASAV